MKLNFKGRLVGGLLVVALGSPGGAFAHRDIILIAYSFSARPEIGARALWLQSVLVEEIGIPEVLTQVKQLDHPCRPSEEAILHICLDGENRMLIPKVERQTIAESFLIFSKMKNAKGSER
jgi:hypothetical protein